MRLNALRPALLALAVLLLLPATLLAKSSHRRAHKTVKVHKQTHKAAAAKSHRSTHKVKPHTVPTSSRRATRHSVKSVRARRSSPRHRSVSTTVRRKATTDDFLKAAAETPAAKSGARKSSAASERAAARATPVVDVVRPAAEKPQLKSVEEEAASPVILPTLYNKRGRLIVPPPLKGTHEILVHQNEVADREGLDRIQNDADLLDMRNKQMLVPLPESYALQVDERLPANRRYCRPWAARFLANMARAHYARFHTPLQINSAVRTAEFQQHLMRINGNAAPAEGDTASPHLTGQAVDLAKHGLSRTEIAWMRGYLLPLIQEGKIDVEEEFHQACFHISIYKKYLPPADVPRRDLATRHSGESTALATAMR